MTKQEKTPNKLEDFVGYMDAARNIETNLETGEKDTREEVSEEAREKLTKLYNQLADKYRLQGDAKKRFVEGQDRESAQMRQQAVSDQIQNSYEQAAKTLREGNNIEAMVGGLKEDKLEALVLGGYGKENAQLIESKAGEGYGDWIKLYAEALTAKRLAKDGVKKAIESGQIKEEQLRGIRRPYAEKMGKEAAERVAKEGLGKAAQKRAAELTEALAVLGFYKDKDDEAVGEFANASEKNLKEYEAKNEGASLRNYVGRALKELANGNTNEYNTARGLLYEMSKKSKED